MKKIVVEFTSELGEKTYKNIAGEGKKESRVNKRIVNAIYSEKVISHKPLTVEFFIKIARLEVMYPLKESIEQGLSRKGAKLGRDYKIKEVTE